MRTALLFTTLLCLDLASAASKKPVEEEFPLYNQIPMHEVLQNNLYLTLTQFGEIVVAYTGKGADLKPDDYVTHADGVKILTGSLQEFLESGVRETVVPVVDDDDVKYGGKRLLGFVMIQSVMPRKLGTRRGEIEFDLEEGGPAPLITVGDIMIGTDGTHQNTGESEYVPPADGGGACITGRDCYFYNGTCHNGHCKCPHNRTGTYCQMEKAEKTGISDVISKHKEASSSKPDVLKVKTESTNPDLPKPIKEQNIQIKRKAAPKLAPVDIHPEDSMTDIPSVPKPLASEQFTSSSSSQDKTGDSTNQGEDMVPISMKPRTEEEKRASEEKKKAKKRAKKGSKKGKGGADDDEVDESSEAESKPQAKKAKRDKNVPDEDELYGPSGLYPSPYVAGKVPTDMVHQRATLRRSNTPFMYSVKFRNGPIGVAFDNRLTNGTVVERVMNGMQAHLSDIKEGDQLIAIDHHNCSLMPAKISQKILTSSPWPIVLTFQAKLVPEDPSIKQKEEAKKRTFNMTVIYPPTLTGEYEVRLTDWTPSINIYHEDSCPVYTLRPAKDIFGCEGIDSSAYMTPSYVQEIIDSGGGELSDLEKKSPMFSMLVYEGIRRKISIKGKSLGIVRRGICTFVKKALNLAVGSADLGIVVNTDDIIVEMPAGKENTSQATVPMGLMRFTDGDLQMISAPKGEILAIVSDPKYGMSPVCSRLATMAEDIIDRWSHSLPFVETKKVLNSPSSENQRMRGEVDEGGRVAISGENGWAFFDYHLALFGPQEVPLGPLKLQMAQPPHGCDSSAYTVRIVGTVVAILRGGGCSFGIKVLNAQKLGAKAVVIVNTDDMQTMRLNALPDETPLIKIPCIMVSRRIQYYLENLLKYHHPIDQHIISIQPTGVFGEYEKRNTLKLPERLPGVR